MISLLLVRMLLRCAVCASSDTICIVFAAELSLESKLCGLWMVSHLQWCLHHPPVMLLQIRKLAILAYLNGASSCKLLEFHAHTLHSIYESMRRMHRPLGYPKTSHMLPTMSANAYKTQCVHHPKTKITSELCC